MRNMLFSLAELEKTFDFEKFQKEYFDLKSWGMQTSIDLKNCNPNIMQSYDHLKKYLYDLSDLIEMTRFGEPTIVFFGGEKTRGHSITQFIETSLISGHFADETHAAFIDIFSCKIYHPLKAAKFTNLYFEAKSCIVSVSFRGSH